MRKFGFFALVALVLAGALQVAFTQTQGQGAPEIISHRVKKHGEAVTAGATGVVTPAITYHNGPLITSPMIYVIWYGNWNQNNGADTPAGQQIVRDFANSVGASPWWQIMTTYTASKYFISGGVAFGGETTDSYSKGSVLKDSDVQSIVLSAINAGKFPLNMQGIYYVLTSSDVTASSGFCTKYCGWHTYARTTKGNVRYSFVGNAARCLSACSVQTVSPNGNAGVDAMVSVIAHELAEAVSDPDLNAWYDSGGAENADKCAWTFGQNIQTLPSGAKYNVTMGSRNFLIQRNLKHDAAGDTCNMSFSTQ